MKVTALIPDDLVDEVRKFSGGETIALKDFTARQKLSQTIQKIRKHPLEFREGFTAIKVRKVNREL